jgi:hypothetical protein
MRNKKLTLATVTFAALLTGCVPLQSSSPKLELKCDESEAYLKDDRITLNLHVLARSNHKRKLLLDSNKENPFDVACDPDVLDIGPEVHTATHSYTEYLTVDQTWKPIPVRISQNCVLLSANIPKTISLEIQYNHDGLHSNKILCEIPVVQKP